MGPANMQRLCGLVRDQATHATDREAESLEKRERRNKRSTGRNGQEEAFGEPTNTIPRPKAEPWELEDLAGFNLKPKQERQGASGDHPDRKLGESISRGRGDGRSIICLQKPARDCGKRGRVAQAEGSEETPIPERGLFAELALPFMGKGDLDRLVGLIASIEYLSQFSFKLSDSVLGGGYHARCDRHRPALIALVEGRKGVACFNKLLFDRGSCAGHEAELATSWAGVQ